MDICHRSNVFMAISKLELMVAHVAQFGVFVTLMAMAIWPYLITETIKSDIKEKKLHALVVFAYYTPLLAIIDHNFWFMKEWGKRLLESIDTNLKDQPTLQGHLKWAKDHVYHLQRKL
jgi:hypothetical protein